MQWNRLQSPGCTVVLFAGTWWLCWSWCGVPPSFKLACSAHSSIKHPMNAKKCRLAYFCIRTTVVDVLHSREVALWSCLCRWIMSFGIEHLHAATDVGILYVETSVSPKAIKMLLSLSSSYVIVALQLTIKWGVIHLPGINLHTHIHTSTIKEQHSYSTK